nr:Sec-independent protein translocase component tatA/E [Nitzschia traheaformis]
MRISFGQILIISIICILMFGDIKNIKKKVFFTFNQLKEYFSKK